MARLFAVLFALVAAVLAVPATVSTYPESWDVDTIPMIGTMDYRPLPGGYGYGAHKPHSCLRPTSLALPLSFFGRRGDGGDGAWRDDSASLSSTPARRPRLARPTLPATSAPTR